MKDIKKSSIKTLNSKISFFKNYIEKGRNNTLFIERQQGFIAGYACALWEMDVISYDDYKNILNKIEDIAMSKILKKVDKILDS